MFKVSLLLVAIAAAAAACSSGEPFRALSAGGAAGAESSISGSGGSSSAGESSNGGGGKSGTIESASAGTADKSDAGREGGSSGTNGVAGEAGSAGAQPCDGACSGATPACEITTNRCVECVDQSTCKSSQTACNTTAHRCVECLDKSTCSTAKPACDTATNACVECTDNPDCKDSAKALCDKTAERCVACLQQSDCKLATASACNAGTCAACTKDAECSNIAGKGVCNAGTCVQCTAAKEAACNGTSCNPALNQCTTTPVGTKDLCQACVADSECIGGTQADPDTRCVPMKFMGTARSGGFCLRRVAKTCAAPYKIPLDAVSLSSAPSETYCGINQDGTRCEAVLDLTTNGGKCADGLDTSCGCTRDRNGTCMQSGLGGLCRMVGVDTNRCTYVCGVPDECPIGKACGGVGYCH